ncbi:MAG: peptide deformylase [Fibrobacteria bacterium]|jgi:peptide deformylase|nr:peptide deformylase [Fibrobacteria bacterium]
MSDRPIFVYGSQVLRKRAEPVAAVTPELQRLADEMLEAMYEANGVGLAAPQVGESVRLFVMDVSQEDGKKDPRVFFNPEIVDTSDKKETAEEGCLSIPDVWADVTRPRSITVRALDRDGKPFEIQNVDGLFARCVQHEIDHLDGVLFVDKISSTDRMLNEGRLKKMARAIR